MIDDIRNIDLKRVESIVYTPENIPSIEDFDTEDYDSEQEMRDDMLSCYEFSVDFYDILGNQMNYGFIYLSYSDVCDIFGENIANKMINNEGIKRGGMSYELTIGVNRTPKSLSLEDVGEVAKQILPVVNEYYKGCRGFILYDGTIINTELEHNQCSNIDGINGTFDFIRLGNIRILRDSIDVWKEPTKQQRNTLRIIINHFINDTLYLDIDNNPVKYFNPDYRQVLGDIDRYFSDGIKPLGRNNLNEEVEETTFHAFYLNIRIFLSDLLKKPFNAEPSKYLKDRGFTKTRLINLLLKKGIITRNEKVVVNGDTDKKKVEHQIKYSVKRNNFERNLKRIHTQFFEKNLPEKINEDGCCGMLGGATSADNCNNSAPITPIGTQIINRPSILVGKSGKKNNNIDPTEIKGKIINEGYMKNSKNFYFTEEQVNKFKKIMQEKMVNEVTTTSTVGSSTSIGSLGYAAPGFNTGKNNGFWKDSLEHNKKGGITCQTINSN